MEKIDNVPLDSDCSLHPGPPIRGRSIPSMPCTPDTRHHMPTAPLAEADHTAFSPCSTCRPSPHVLASSSRAAQAGEVLLWFLRRAHPVPHLASSLDAGTPSQSRRTKWHRRSSSHTQGSRSTGAAPMGPTPFTLPLWWPHAGSSCPANLWSGRHLTELRLSAMKLSNLSVGAGNQPSDLQPTWHSTPFPPPWTPVLVSLSTPHLP
jgi:hypothetical protein